MWRVTKFIIWKKKQKLELLLMSTASKMPTLWDFFHKSDEKQNSAHYKSYCKGCLDKQLARIPIPGGNLDPAEKILAETTRFQLGEKFSWVTFPIYLINLINT
jgi:hypothetical protein